MSATETTARRAVLHRNLVLVRAADEAQLDELLGRAAVRTLLVHRVEPAAALFPRTALAALRRRLDDMETPFVLSELPSLRAVLEAGK